MNPETELLETEEKYVNSLRFIIHSYLEPLEKFLEELKISYDLPENRDKGVLFTILKRERVDIVAVIFSNINQLLHTNEVILETLQQSQHDHASPHDIVQNFRKVVPTLKFYSDYIKNSEASRELLKRLEPDLRFSAFIRAIELQAGSQGLTLESQLAKPWQRVMKYELLLREICERAEPGEERESIRRTIEEIREINTGLNKSQAASENQKLLLEKQRYYGLKDLSAPARYFVRDGVLRMVTASRRREVSFILCNDLLFYGRRAGALTQAQFKSCDIHQILVFRYPEREAKTFMLRISADEGRQLRPLPPLP
jgi:hypothetical protein